MARHHGRKVARRHPLQPGHRVVAGGGAAGGVEVLALADHGHCDLRMAGQQRQRLPDHDRSLQGGVQAEKGNPEPAGRGRGALLPRREPRLRSPDRDDDPFGPRTGRQQLDVLGGVDQDEAGRSHGEPVEGVEQPELRASADPAVARRVSGEDHLVEGDTPARVEQPGQQHVEMAEIADEHGVVARPVGRSAAVPAAPSSRRAAAPAGTRARAGAASRPAAQCRARAAR